MLNILIDQKTYITYNTYYYDIYIYIYIYTHDIFCIYYNKYYYLLNSI